MDAKTRHELKQNELAEVLEKLRHWDNPSTRYTVLGVVVIVVLFCAWKLWDYTRSSAMSEAWTQLSTTTDAYNALDENGAKVHVDKLNDLISSGPSAAVRDYAQLRLASIHIDQAFKQVDHRTELFEEAHRLLTELIAPSKQPAIAAAAAFALASVEESLLNMDAARENYEMLQNEERFSGSPYSVLAGVRLADIDTVETEFTFVEGMRPIDDATRAMSVGQGIGASMPNPIQPGQVVSGQFGPPPPPPAEMSVETPSDDAAEAAPAEQPAAEPTEDVPAETPAAEPAADVPTETPESDTPEPETP